MDRKRALQFVRGNKHHKFYQPVIFSPGVIEIRGKWHEGTKNLARTIFAEIRDKSLLDLGCNSGFFLQEALLGGCREAVGVDNDIVAISHAVEINDILEMRAKLIHEDICAFLPPKKFDVILLLALYPVTTLSKIVTKYLEFANEYLILEHEGDWAKNSFDVVKEFPSPRVAGQRNIFYLRP